MEDKIIRINSINEVHEFYGLKKPKHPLVSIIPIDDKVVNYDYGEFTYILDLYQINLKCGISGSMVYGRNSYDFQEGTLVFMKPGQSVKIEQNEIIKGSSGWTLFFHPDLIRKHQLGKSIENYSFFLYETSEALHLSEDEKEIINNLVNKIEKEYNQNIDRHSQKLIVANIELLLDYCTRFYDRQFYTRSDFSKDIVTQFEKLLVEYYNSETQIDSGIPSVKYCAEILHKSPNYLSDLLKKETGRSAIDHIHFYIIEKAKNMLLGSEDTISEIAFQLGFEYPHYFGKLFKSKTGKSPTDYRLAN